MINDALNIDLRAQLVNIDHANQSVIAKTLDGERQVMVSILSAQRSFAKGDVVQIVHDSHSDTSNVHHENMGKYGLVIEIDVMTREVTFLDDTQQPVSLQKTSSFPPFSLHQIHAPPYLLESYLPNQLLSRPNTITRNDSGRSEETMQLEDITSVKTGPHMGVSGTVVEIHGGMVQLCPIDARQPSNVIIQIASLSFYPPPTTLQFTTD